MVQAKDNVCLRIEEIEMVTEIETGIEIEMVTETETGISVLMVSKMDKRLTSTVEVHHAKNVKNERSVCDQ
jgi:hypothetical protein